MTKWQDISTAPKDGTELPLYRHDAGWFSGFYGTWEHIHTTEREAGRIDEDEYFYASWWAFTRDGVMRLEGEEAPTHWFRLPTPPTKGE